MEQEGNHGDAYERGEKKKVYSNESEIPVESVSNLRNKLLRIQRLSERQDRVFELEKLFSESLDSSATCAENYRRMVQDHESIPVTEIWDSRDLTPQCITPIAMLSKTGAVTSFGTGCLVEWGDEAYLATAIHVVWNWKLERFNGDRIEFFLPNENQDGRNLKRRTRCFMNMNRSFFCDHPTRDLIVFPLLKNSKAGYIRGNLLENTELVFRTLPVLPRERRKEMSMFQLSMYGYSNGIGDENLCATARKAFPASPIDMDRNKRICDGYVDTYVYPGASGGPIILQTSINNKKLYPNRVFTYAVGILSQGPIAKLNPFDTESKEQALLNLGEYVLLERLADKNFLDDVIDLSSIIDGLERMKIDDPI